ncbi:Short C-terminal domain [Hoeflea sp. IMCC20628]|uniref:SHOCT domain-containing protein n=1 Tax=Hoeflea sp. IMCC20628 TaxID=1620421 RepID=UPI00063A893B|nr:SHOCT domain-containing protein [Hoeflea sp. IMCC20628]AKI00849.1 Short C-terminal domain [Hoeflea sp. IMCC20628]
MADLTPETRQALAEIASRHGVGPDAVEHLLMALIAGQGTQAQFNHPELGGMGQWSSGGMTMVGDMFNNGLKAKVDAICNDVAQMMRQSAPLQVPSSSSTQTQSQGSDRAGVSLFVSGFSAGNWWPEGLGQAASTGSQNQMRYAWFPDTSRLAIDSGDGNVRIYDTADHRIGGFSQQQSGDQSLRFTSQHGVVKLSELRQVNATRRNDGTGNHHTSPSLSEALLNTSASEQRSETLTAPPEPSEHEPASLHSTTVPPSVPVTPKDTDETDIFAKIERLAALHHRGILTDAEYQTKKAELLARI